MMAPWNSVLFELSIFSDLEGQVSAVISMSSALILFTRNNVTLMENRIPNEVISTADHRLIEIPNKSYALAGTSDEFEINKDNGNIRTKKSFDFEKDPQRYEIGVEIRDEMDEVVDRAFLIINIVNEDEAPQCLRPEFLAGTEVISINENHPMLVPFYSVNATDEDKGDKLTLKQRQCIAVSTPWTFTLPGVNTLLLIHAGVTPPRIATPLCIDGPCKAKRMQLVRIPGVTSKTLMGLKSNQRGCSCNPWPPINADTDMSSPCPLLYKYSLELQTSAPIPNGNFFSVDPTTGAVSRTSAEDLDFEEGYQTSQLKLRATDKTGLFCVGMLTINIDDLNDESPEFQKFPGDKIEVPEDTLVNTIIATVTAIDRDAGSMITYWFAVPQTVFDLNPDTGDITLLEKLDYDNPDNPKRYPLLIEAKDNDDIHTSSYTVTVVVVNVDEPPICDPNFADGISQSVSETLPINTVVYRIQARDPDEGDDVKFEIKRQSESTAVYFRLDEDTGVISTTNIPLDYEKDPKIFEMTVSATNKKVDPKACTGSVTFRITNENDERPVLTNVPTEHIIFDENQPAGTLLFQLQATDRDIGDSVRFEFTEVHKGFTINEDTGKITLSFPPDAEDTRTPLTQVVRVRAYDNDRVHSAEAQLTLSVQDLNDNSPKCEDNLIVKTLPETTPIGTHLLELKCVDGDITAPNNILKYSMDLDGYSRNKFKLNNNELILGPNGLDYDNASFAAMQFKHTLVIRVSDLGDPSLTSTVTVILRVTRENEFSPAVTENEFSVAENSDLGTVVGTVRFTDSDWPFDNVKYTVVGDGFGNPPKFSIEPDTGVIKVLNALDRETKARYTATIQAADINNDIEPDPLKQRKRTAVVTINILNVNDEPPLCVPAHYEVTIKSTDKTRFLQLKCSDKDSPDNQLRYSITGGNSLNRFTLQRIDDDPPFLATRQNFQYSELDRVQDPTDFQLLIEVTDELGGNKAAQLTSTATVTVHVVPWATTVPTKPTTTRTTTMTTSVLVKYSYIWHPDKWFPALLAITSFLLLLCLYALAWGILKDSPKCAKFFPLCHGCKGKPQLHNMENINNPSRHPEGIDRQQSSNEKSTIIPPPTAYDGRAVDLATGKHYLFNSRTGEIQWLS